MSGGRNKEEFKTLVNDVIKRQKSLLLAQEILIEDFLKDFKNHTTNLDKSSCTRFCRIIQFSYRETLRELIKTPVHELKKHRGIGEGMLAEFEKYLELRGFRLEK